MGVFRQRGLSPEGRVVILGHASTETRYDESSVLFRYVKGIAREVVSFDLPAHGANALPEGQILDTEEFLGQFARVMDELVDDRETVYIGYSLGALLGNKYFAGKRLENVRVVSIGAGLRLGDGAAERISSFFDPSTFRAPQTVEFMRRAHGEHWENLIVSLNHVLTDVALFPNDNEIEWIHDADFHFILAEKDQAFSEDDISFAVPVQRIHRVGGNHFTYFRVGKPWRQTREVLLKLLNS